MTGQIIRFSGDQHSEVRSLLPWYLTGRLDEAERAMVEVHLGACAECQAEAKAEDRLAAQLAELHPAKPMHDVEHGWARLRRRIELDPPRRARCWAPPVWLSGGLSEAARQWRGSAVSLRWVVALQFGLLVIASALLAPYARPAHYRALGARPAVASGNVVVIFRPDIREKDLRATLVANDARLVDGPTAADAYLLNVPAAERGAVLARLRKSERIELAEPVDGSRP